jgi:PPP family 3-phenylpropionic acid transporter
MRRLLKFISLRRFLLVSALLSVLRWLMIALYADNLWLLLTAQILHAATFGTAHVTAIHLVQSYFGQHHQGIGQALTLIFPFDFWVPLIITIFVRVQGG